MPIMKTCITEWSDGNNWSESLTLPTLEVSYTILYSFFSFSFWSCLLLNCVTNFQLLRRSWKGWSVTMITTLLGFLTVPPSNLPPLTQLSSLLHTTFTFTCFFNIFDQQGLDREGDGARGRMKILHKPQFCNRTGKRLLLSELVTLTTVQSYKTFI